MSESSGGSKLERENNILKNENFYLRNLVCKLKERLKKFDIEPPRAIDINDEEDKIFNLNKQIYLLQVEIILIS